MRYEGSLAQRKATSTAVTSKLGLPFVEKQLTSACVYYGRERTVINLRMGGPYVGPGVCGAGARAAGVTLRHCGRYE